MTFFCKSQQHEVAEFRMIFEQFTFLYAEYFSFVKGVETSKIGPSGIYVNVDGVKGHYITKEIEINQGHSKTTNYGKDSSYTPPEVTNARNNSHGYRPSIGWQMPPPDRTYPSEYEPIGSGSNDDRRKPGWRYNPINKTQSETPLHGKPNEKIDRGPRNDKGIELPTVSIEEDYNEKTDESQVGKEYEKINFAEVVEPDPDKYNVDVLEGKESWKPRVAFENKTKKSNDNSVIMSINKKTTDVEILDVKLSPWHEGK